MMPHKLRVLLLAGFVPLALTPQSVSGQQLAPQPLRYRTPTLAASVGIGLSASAFLATAVFQSRLPYATCAPCDPAGLLGIDRAVVGPVRPTFARISDMTLLATMGAAGTMLAARSDRPSQERMEDAAVFLQAVSTAAAVEAWSKVLFHRPRPVRYTADAADPFKTGDGLSFPSGHAALAFAAAAAYASVSHRRGATGRGTETALLFTAAAATAVLRVAARRHFPTDVAAGALMGGLIGWVVPAVYPAR